MPGPEPETTMILHTAQQINNLLQQQIYGTELLEQILKIESDNLVKRNYDAIQKLNQKKSEQSIAIEVLSQQQRQLLERSGFSYSPEGMNEFVGNLAPASATQLQKKQQQLQMVLERCQKLNMINGNIIAANKHTTETALAILRGQRTPESLVYSAGGHAVISSPSKPVIKA